MKAYIITLFNNSISETAARICRESALRHGYEAEYFEASTGKSGREFLKREKIQPIIVTGRADSAVLKHQRRWVSQPGTLGCYASHFRLWQRAVELQEPIVIFEHDALVLAPFPAIDWKDVLHFECEGNITRLGTEWARDDCMETGTGLYRLKFRPVELPDLVCIPCGHAYAIKPHAAQALIDDAKANGWFAVDRAIREPIVTIETHNPSLATFQPKFMYVSTTTSRLWKIRQSIRHGFGKAILRLKQGLGTAVTKLTGYSRSKG